ncbi:MAG: hypothetical protein K0R61_3504 [Microvirga sp.]|jgi:hypothetical protein|nr:hypothetical protein [Microvirga sp.]
MPVLSHRPLLRPLGQGLAVAALLAGMALMAFAAGIAFLGAMVALPIAIGLMAVRQRLQGGPEPAMANASTLAPHLTRP